MLLAEKGAEIKVWNQKNKTGLTPLVIAEGYRPGLNFRPSPETDAELKVDVNNSTANHVVEMMTNDVPVGEITLDQLGEGALQLDARDGDKVPSAQARDVIEVVDVEDGRSS